MQRSFASGLETLTALSHDHVLRRNVRIGLHRNTEEHLDPFLASTHGSHHIRLIDGVAKTWNGLLSKIQSKTGGRISLKALPELRAVSSDERFGIVNAEYVTTYQNLLQIKEEPEDSKLLDLSEEDESVAAGILHDLNIDPVLLLQPASSNHLRQKDVVSQS